jgi:hypothetical protein
MMAAETRRNWDMTKKRQPQWQFTIDVKEDGETWRWIHIDSRGGLQHSVSGFSGFDGCAANAKQYGWPGLRHPTILKSGSAVECPDRTLPAAFTDVRNSD